MAGPTEPVIPPWCDPDALATFLDSLRHTGYRIGTAQFVACQDLVLALTVKADFSDSPDKVTRLLGPVVCSCPEEQADFRFRFERWVEGFRRDTGRQESPPPRPAPLAEPRSRSSETRARRLMAPSWIRFFLTAVAVVGVTTLIIVLWSVVGDFTSDMGRLKIGLREITLTIFEILGMGALYGGAVLLLWRLFQRLRTRRYLTRRGGSTGTELELSLNEYHRKLNDDVSLYGAAKALRQREGVPSTSLSVPQTVDRTVRNGGWFTPVYGTRQVVPEYLALIERVNLRDQLGCYYDELIDELEESGVHVTRYYFQEDPRVMMSRNPGRPPVSLRHLSAVHSDYRVIVFTDGRGLFNVFDARLADWLMQFEGWSRVTLATPVPEHNWGYRESLLRQRFTVVPATAVGLARLAPGSLPLSDKRASHKATSAPIPEQIMRRPTRWLERDPVEPSLLESTLVGLRRALGEDTYQWLCACAVYPELHWNLTRFLGDALGSRGGGPASSASGFASMLRLPWFRHGHMPDWLRSRLIAALPEAEDARVRRALQGLLVSSVVGQGTQFALDIARERGFSASSFAQALFGRIARKSPDPSAINERVFATFMRAGRLSLRIPWALRKRLREPGPSYQHWDADRLTAPEHLSQWTFKSIVAYYISLFWDICLLRKGPQHVPYSISLLVLIVIIDIAVTPTALYGSVFPPSPLVYLALYLATNVYTWSLLWLVLRMRTLQSRFVKTAVAGAGSGLLITTLQGILTLITFTAARGILDLNTILNELSPGGALLLRFGGAIWGLSVIGAGAFMVAFGFVVLVHIIRQATELSVAKSLALGLVTAIPSEVASFIMTFKMFYHHCCILELKLHLSSDCDPFQNWASSAKSVGHWWRRQISKGMI